MYVSGLSATVIILSLIILYFTARIGKYKQAERLLVQQNEALMDIHEELSAQEEELRQNFNELYLNEERIRQQEEMYRLVTEGSNDGLWIWDIISDTQTLSERGLHLLELSEQAVNTHEKWKKLVHPDDLPHLLAELDQHLSRRTQLFGTEYRVKSPAGGYRWILSRGKALFDGNGQPIRMAGSYTDITDRKFKEEKIKHMAYYDTLTGLANRELLTETVCEALTKAKEQGTHGALLFIDLDNFKLINDTYGHSWGDQLLINISRQLAELVVDAGLAARLGGDEIIIFLPAINTAEEAAAYAEQVMRLLEKPVTVNEHIFHITASAGIALYPEHGSTIDELLRNADTAMYSAKNSGKRGYMVFDESMHNAVVEKTLLESRLRQALRNHELRLYYQPQFDMAAERVAGFEALLRWESPDYGLMPPLKFIPLAEETGLIVEIGMWVLAQACAFSQELYDKGLGRLWVSVNISVVQLIQPGFVQGVADVLAATGLPPHLLELEITESVLMEQLADNVRKLAELRDLGIRIALDDFGTGYSSLTYLKKLPITAVKMDKAFIDDIAAGGIDAAVTGTIIELSHQMGLTVVAEGVETENQFTFLQQKKCDIIQGYLISWPLPPAEFAELIRTSEKLIGSAS